MKKITSQLILVSVFFLSSFVSISQDGIIWDEFESQIALPLDQLEAHTVGATAPASCNEAVVVTSFDETFSGGCYGNVFRTYIATACNYVDTAFQIISVTNAMPAIDLNISLECSDAIPEVITSINNVGETIESISLTNQTDNTIDPCNRVITRTYEVTFSCGTPETFTQVITIHDNTAPTMTGIPADVTIECGSDIPASVVPDVADNCDASPQWEVSEVVNPLTCGTEIIRTYRAYDSCGNENNHTQVITIVDTTAPVFDTMMSDVTVNCTDLIPAPIISATDVCDDDVDVVFSQEMTGDCPYTLTRTWVATDFCGNTATMTQVITVIDEIAPVWNDFAPEIDLNYEDIDFQTIAASDNCDDDVLVTFVDESFSGGCFGNIFRTYTATDNCGNSVTATQIIHLFDYENPQIFNVPADLELVCGDAIPTVPTNVYTTDNISEVNNPDLELTLNYTEEQTNDFCPYQIIRTWVAEDACGNETTAVQVINVAVAASAPSPISIVSVNPNPILNQAKIQFVSEVNTHAVVDIFDVHGRLMKTVFNASIDADNIQEAFVLANDLEEGIYLVKVQTTEGEVIEKIMVSK